MVEILRAAAMVLRRKLDGKGRVWLPGECREVAGWSPDEPVAVTLITYRDNKNNIRYGFLITAQADEEGGEENHG